MAEKAKGQYRPFKRAVYEPRTRKAPALAGEVVRRLK